MLLQVVHHSQNHVLLVITQQHTTFIMVTLVHVLHVQMEPMHQEKEIILVQIVRQDMKVQEQEKHHNQMDVQHVQKDIMHQEQVMLLVQNVELEIIKTKQENRHVKIAHLDMEIAQEEAIVQVIVIKAYLVDIM